MRTAEQVTVPIRFLTTVGHLLTVLTVLYDLDEISERGDGKDSDDYNMLAALAYISIVTLCIEFLSMFSGVSIFFPGANSFHSVLHFFGIVFVGLFATQRWDVAWFGWLSAMFCFIPMLVELVIGYSVFRLRVLEFS